MSEETKVPEIKLTENEIKEIEARRKLSDNIGKCQTEIQEILKKYNLAFKVVQDPQVILVPTK